MTYLRWSVAEILGTLKELSENYWWSWAPDGASLFRDIDPELWESSHHNPRRVLENASHHRLTQVATDPTYLARIDRLARRFRNSMNGAGTWASRNAPGIAPETPVAYFCMEFGVHESLPIYSGGLGILAGDHLKSASDLGLPLVGVGLLYKEGYFHQAISQELEQLDYFLTQDFDLLPISSVMDENGDPLGVLVQLPERELTARVWRVKVGRVTLYLLDANVDENAPEDRRITARLYGGDRDTRIQQEILLGIGGVRALRALGITPSVFHLNEGHASFLTLELARELVLEGAAFAEARDRVREMCVFTTHTPVPAGNDEFSPEMMEAYFSGYWPALGLSREEFFALGSSVESVVEASPAGDEMDGTDNVEPAGFPHFGVTPLAIRMCRHTNGVSARHGEVSREMWQSLFPGARASEVPIGHITNGVHTRTWIAPSLWALYDRHLGGDWAERMTSPETWEAVERIPDEELWAVHQALKERLVAYARHHLAQARIARGDTAEHAMMAYELLDPRALTLGFARRFAAYKRGDLLFHDPDRLAAVLGNPERPVQIVYAGKSHPADGEGKAILRRVMEFATDPRFARWVVFLEDYDINIARHLVRGVDVWVNNPRRPLEASGTSGEKVALNGGLNLSVLDGWWIEGFDGRNGWAVGGERTGLTHEQEDAEDAASLYDLLATEVVPLYYDRDEDGLPRRWIERMKHAIRSLSPVYNTDRMVAEYFEKYYLREVAAMP